MDPISWAVPAAIGLATLAMMWVMLRQKVGVDTVTILRADLTNAEAKLTRAEELLARVTADNELCKQQQDSIRERYETILSELRAENRELLRESIGVRRRITRTDRGED